MYNIYCIFALQNTSKISSGVRVRMLWHARDIFSAVSG